MRRNTACGGRGTMSPLTSGRRSKTFTSVALDEYKERLKWTRIDDEQEKSEGCKEKLEEQHHLDIE